MLVDHPDPRSKRVAGEPKTRACSSIYTAPESGRYSSREDRTERRLPGSVLTDDRMHLAGAQLEVDVAARHGLAELLAHPAAPRPEQRSSRHGQPLELTDEVRAGSIGAPLKADSGLWDRPQPPR